MNTDWPVLTVKNKGVSFYLSQVDNEDGSFDTYIVSGTNKILFLHSDNFEDMLEAMNTMSMAFAVLNNRVEHSFQGGK